MTENSFTKEEETYWCRFDKVNTLKPIPGIYILYCVTSGKYYVGESLNIRKRFYQHINSKKQLIHKVIKRRGIDNFLYYIEYFPDFKKSDLLLIEEFLIVKYNSLVPNGYNICERGSDQSDRICSDKTREKMSNARLGMKLSESIKGKISKAHTGRKLSSDHKSKISNSRIGAKLSDITKGKISKARKGVRGKPLTDEHKEKLRQSKLGKKHSEEHIRKCAESRIGRKYSDETKKKMSESRKRYLESNTK